MLCSSAHRASELSATASSAVWQKNVSVSSSFSTRCRCRASCSRWTRVGAELQCERQHNNGCPDGREPEPTCNTRTPPADIAANSTEPHSAASTRIGKPNVALTELARNNSWRSGEGGRQMQGRCHELEVITLELDAVLTNGEGRCLVIEGEPGLGKTTLLNVCAAEAHKRGFRTLRCSGVQSQSGIGFAGLHELIHPLLPHLEKLPARQRVALSTAFGIDDGPAPDRLFINLAVLGLIEESSHEQPVALIVDDAQWLDRSTLDVLTFVGKRLSTAEAVLLCAERPESDGHSAYLDNLPSLLLPALDTDAAAAVLQHVINSTPALHGLDAAMRTRILEEASGNPLAIIELGAAVAELDPCDLLLADSPMPTTRRIEDAFLGQLVDLSDGARTLLLVAAAAESLSVTELRRAADYLEIDDSAISALRSRGLLKLSEQSVETRHPLIRSAVYGAASLSARATVNRALAATLDNHARAVWHRAAATYGTDDGVAAELELTAASASSYGAHADAAAALRRSAAMSADTGEKVRRLSAAAESARRAGLGTEAARILGDAIGLNPAPNEVVQLEVTRFVLSAMGAAPKRSVVELLTLAETFDQQQGDNALFGQAFLIAGAALRWQMYGQRAREREIVADAVTRARRKPSSTPIVTDILEIAEATVNHRRNTARFGARAQKMLQDYRSDPLLLSAIALSSEYTWNLDIADSAWSTLAGWGASVGSPVHEGDGLRGRAQSQIHTGALREAKIRAEAALRLSESAQIPDMAAGAAATLARAAAWQGEFDTSAEMVARGREFLSHDPDVVWNAHLHWAAGLATLTAGDPANALTHLACVSSHPQIELWAIGDLTEAAIAADQANIAVPAVRRAADHAAALDSPFLTMLSQRCLAQLSVEPDETHRRFVAAVEAGRTADAGLECARTQLAFGKWLRRNRKVVASREYLTEAAHAFDTLGARPWADIAESELRAAGVASSTGPASRRHVIESLSAQELHIAQLAADGLTNREIADRIYLSPRTVAASLYRLFPKLGITARSQIAGALAVGNDGGRMSGE